jgi:hypothetical protein
MLHILHGIVSLFLFVRNVFLLLLGALLSLGCLAAGLLYVLSRFDADRAKEASKDELMFKALGAKQLAPKLVRTLGHPRRGTVVHATSKLSFTQRAQHSSAAQTRLLRVQVTEARELLSYKNAAPDAFVRVSLGDQVSKSKVVRKSNSPKV